ncbi:hypothetical protein NUU61_007343 [Penicillium alfredii]|uniref:Protein kinase domain-containing protein n=1 Tax=Penicillium alfredii TaxID=1506179 RepID=A0A9W9K462_9EURO|nr:uncharacterized protein NUU61_007343 [Penicillium alfredii]KAJ5092473.1 hypothetical protein NUU61_007343 [Penicillium alfredii]
MHLFNTQLLLWALYSLLIPPISSIPIPEDPDSTELQVPQYDHESTLVPRNALAANSLLENRNDDPRPASPIARCGYQFGSKEPSGVKGEKKYVMKEGGKEYGSVRLQHKLGSGNQGAVWEGVLKYYPTSKNKGMGLPILAEEPVAVKVGSGGRGIDRGILQRQIVSPYVLPLKELFWSENTRESVQVMPRGLYDLTTALEKGLVIVVAVIMLRVGEALLAAHHQWIVHGDIKPDNILLSHYGWTYLIDWDVAKKLTERIETRPRGQYDYYGPEARNKEPYDAFKEEVFEFTLTWLEADQPPFMQNPDFRDDLYNWLTAPGDKDTAAGRTYAGIADHLGLKFGVYLSESKKHLMAKGLCAQQERFDLPVFLNEFRRVNMII